MDPQKEGSMSLKDRLLQYQENARKQKEYDKKQQNSVSQLDSSMTDVSKYSRASSVVNRKATTVSADMVNRLDPNLLEDFNASASLNMSLGSMSFLHSPAGGYKSPVRGGFRSPAMGFRSPVMSKLELSSKRVEAREEPELRALFLQALANSSDEDVKQLEDDPKVNFSDLRSRYLRSIFALIPDYGDISDLSKERRLAIFRDDAHKREEYVTIRDAWDIYEQKALAQSHELTSEDKQMETKIKATETDIAEQWANLAEQVVDDILKGSGDTQAEDGDDSLLASVEAARRMAVENENRQQFKDRAELKRQALPLNESIKEEQTKDESVNGNQYNSASSFSLTFLSEDGTENCEGGSKWAEEARRQRLEYQSRTAEDYEEGSDQDEYVIDQAKRLRRAYIRHLANQKDSDSESEEDENVDNVSKWIAEARQLKHLSRSKLQMSLGGSNSSVARDVKNCADETDVESDENDERESSRNLNKGDKVWNSDTSDSDDSDGSNSVYLWREEARRMKEKARAKRIENDEEVGVKVGFTAEESESSYYEEVVKKAMELEKKYNQRRNMLNSNDDGSSGSDDLDRSHWLEAARSIKAKGRYKLDDPAKQAWLDEAKRLREVTAARDKDTPENDSVISDDENDEEIALKALKMCQVDQSATNESWPKTHSKEDISDWVQKARLKETGRRKTLGSSRAWLQEARRIRAEALAKDADDTRAEDDEPETLKDNDVEIAKKAKNLRREYIRERLKYNFESESDADSNDIDDLSRWIEAAIVSSERRLKKSKVHSLHSSKKKWYEDSDDSGSDDDDFDEAKRASFIEAAKRLRVGSTSKEVLNDRQSGVPSSELERDLSKNEADFYSDVVKKAMALEKKYREQRAAREKGKANDPEELDPAIWILEAQKIKDDFAEKPSAKNKKKSRKAKKEKKKKEKKSRKTSNTSLKEKPKTLPDQTKADGQSPRKEAGSSRSSSQWIEEARERKEKAILALKAAKEEVRARQSMSTKGLSLEEKKKLRLARLQEAMERREAEAKRDIEARRKEAESIKMTRRKSVEWKKKAFYSDSSGSDEGTSQIEASVVAGEESIEGKHKPKKHTKKSKEHSSRRLSAASSARNHRRSTSTAADDEGSFSGNSLGSTSRLDAMDFGVPTSPNAKQSYPSEQFGASLSESSYSEESVDHNTRGRRIPDESAYIVSTDPSSSETVCSDSSAEAARVKSGAAIGRATTKKKAPKPMDKSGISNADEHEILSPTRTKKNHEQSKASKATSPKKSKKTGLERAALTLDSPTKSKTKEEDMKRPKSPKKSKKTGDPKAPKSPKKSAKAEKTAKSPEKIKQKVGSIENSSQEAESSATATAAISQQTTTAKE